ncbi:MAG: hypothetical protein V4525_08395 [Pseudomonadota bacterium]
MPERLKITIYIDHVEDSSDFDEVTRWLARWANKVSVESYSTGGWEHCWDLLAIEEAVTEVPKEWLCASEWAAPEIFEKKSE